MKFSLSTAVVLFCASSALAFPHTNVTNGIASNDEDGLNLSGIDIQDVDYDPSDFESLETRATIKCSNVAKIKRVKAEYKGKCDPANSKGFKSAHNCQNKSGKSYLCVQNNKATCYVSVVFLSPLCHR
jgi:hypothetical protein